MSKPATTTRTNKAAPATPAAPAQPAAAVSPGVVPPTPVANAGVLPPNPAVPPQETQQGEGTEQQGVENGEQQGTAQQGAEQQPEQQPAAAVKTTEKKLPYDVIRADTTESITAKDAAVLAGKRVEKHGTNSGAVFHIYH